MSQRSLIYLPEPRLDFRFNQQLEYPRDGLFLYGPVDAAEVRRQVRFGVIGTKDGVRRFREWAASVSRFIDVPPRGRASKENAAHHVAFPGFAEAFHSDWSGKPLRVIDDIDAAELLRAMRIENRHEAIKTAVDMFVEPLVDDSQRQEDQPSFWYVVIPEFIYQLGRPKSRVPKDDRVPGRESHRGTRGTVSKKSHVVRRRGAGGRGIQVRTQLPSAIESPSS